MPKRGCPQALAPLRRQRGSLATGELPSEPLDKPLKRIRHKSPPSLALSRIPSGPALDRYALPCKSRGHYDALRIGRRATPAAIRRAYRTRALVTHPDKGGHCDVFQAVLTAFEVLNDQTTKNTYDCELERTGCLDGFGWSDTVSGFVASQIPSDKASTSASTVKYLVACRQAFEIMKQAIRGEVDITSLSSYELLILQRALRQSETGGLHAAGYECELAQRASNSKDKRSKRVVRRSFKYLTYSYRDDLYCVQVVWHGFRVQTQMTHYLEQAIDWQISLMGMHTRALRRCSQARPGQEVEPLIEDEAMDALCENPGMRLTFGSIQECKGKATCTPFTRDLALALSMRKEMRRNKKFDKVAATKKVRQVQAEREKAHAVLLKAVDKEMMAQAMKKLERQHNSAALEYDRDVAVGLQIALHLDMEATSALTARINGLQIPPKELARRVEQLVAALPCNSPPSSASTESPSTAAKRMTNCRALALPTAAPALPAPATSSPAGAAVARGSPRVGIMSEEAAGKADAMREGRRLSEARGSRTSLGNQSPPEDEEEEERPNGIQTRASAARRKEAQLRKAAAQEVGRQAEPARRAHTPSNPAPLPPVLAGATSARATRLPRKM